MQVGTSVFWINLTLSRSVSACHCCSFGFDRIGVVFLPRQPLVSSVIITTHILATGSLTADSLGTDSVDAMEPQVVLVCVAFILCASYILRYPAHAYTISVLLLFELLVGIKVSHHSVQVRSMIKSGTLHTQHIGPRTAHTCSQPRTHQ